MTVNGISGSYYQYQNTLNMLQLSNARLNERRNTYHIVPAYSSCQLHFVTHSGYRRTAQDVTELY